MIKLAVIILAISFCNAKLLKQFNVPETESFRMDAKPGRLLQRPKVVSKDILWVLDIDGDLNLKQLKSANKMDMRVFREVVQPSIINYELTQALSNNNNKFPRKNSTSSTNVKGKNSEEITKYDLKKAIARMLNKFVLFFKEPSLHTHIGDNNKVSIKLYFKGPYTSMVVRYKNKRYNYFFQPPCSLPSWFYEKHTKITYSGQTKFVKIPDNVRKEFYGRFFNLLNLFLSYAI